MSFDGFSAEPLFEGIPGRWLRSPSDASGGEGQRLRRMAPLLGSSPDCVCFFFARAYADELPGANPGVLVTGEPFVSALSAAGLSWFGNCRVFVAENPAMAMALLSARFAVKTSTVAHLGAPERPEIHSSAVIAPTATIGAGVRIGAGCVIEAGAVIGDGVVLYPRCFVGPEAVIGRDSVLFPGVVVYEQVRIGERVRIHANSVLGADGFGYVPRLVQGSPVEHVKVYHTGRVVIGDDVELGAAVTIDRATFGETRVERGAKLDNGVHVGHNARVGEGSILCGGVGLAGRAKTGRFSVLGGMAGVNNDTLVGDFAQVAAMTPVAADVPAGAKAAGNPQREYHEHFRIHAMLNKLLKERAGARRDGGQRKEQP